MATEGLCDLPRTSALTPSSGGRGRVPEQEEDADGFYPAAPARLPLDAGDGPPRRLSGQARRLLPQWPLGRPREALVGSRLASGPWLTERML
jgi:hypothetical protein